MESTKVFIDANVLLEVLLKREKNIVAAKALSEIYPIQTRHCISALTGHLVVHFKPEQIKLAAVELFLKDFYILGLESEDFDWAFKNCRNEDFEDALQVAAAIRNGCTTFVTLDKELAKAYDNLPTLKIKLL